MINNTNNTNFINVHHETNIAAHGKHCTSWSKPVVCITNGIVYASVTDAADAENVCIPNMIRHLKGGTNTIHGKVYKYLSEIMDNPELILARLRETTACSAECCKGKKKRSAEEARQKKIAALQARVERRKRINDQKQAEAKKSGDRLDAAMAELIAAMSDNG